MTDSENSPDYERREALIIINPVAHNAPHQRRLEEMFLWLQSQGWQASWEETKRAGDATTFARDAAGRGIPLVVACDNCTSIANDDEDARQ